MSFSEKKDEIINIKKEILDFIQEKKFNLPSVMTALCDIIVSMSIQISYEEDFYKMLENLKTLYKLYKLHKPSKLDSPTQD